MTATKRQQEEKQERIEKLQRVLRLPHTIEQLSLRLGVAEGTVWKDLQLLRPRPHMNREEDPPTYVWRSSENREARAS